MHPLTISTSLDAKSRSRIIARHAHARFLSLDPASSLIDLADLKPPLPLCGGAGCYDHPALSSIASAIRSAACILLTMPVYNFAAGATAKNLVELTGDAWQNKTVGLAVAAGGHNAFMAPISLAASLMLDFRCIVIPRYVYALSSAFSPSAVTDPDTTQRIHDLADELLRVGKALA